MLRVSDEGHVRWLRFARPERLNAFTVAAYREFRLALDDASTDPDVHVVVLAGEGRAYSVGADRSLLDGSSSEVGLDAGLDAGAEFEQLLRTMTAFSKPLVAAVNGMAVGFGATMLLHCDLVVAARSASFRFPFTAMGIAPEAASTELLTRRVRFDEAMWSMLSSEWIEADRARAIGLVWRVADDDTLASDVREITSTLADLDPAAVAAAKRLLITEREVDVLRAHRRELEEMGQLMARRLPSHTQEGSP